MNTYTVTYAPSDYSSDRKQVTVVASSISRATDFVNKRKFLGYSGRVTNVDEGTRSVHIAR